MEQILSPGVFNSERSLTQEIQELCDPWVEIEISRITNLVVKYLTNFKNKGGLEDTRLTQGDVNSTYDLIIKENSPGIINKIMRKLNQTGYQELMLACPSTVSIVHDIISRPLHDVLGNKSHYTIDAWSWSGILQVAFHIQARRSWLIPSTQTSRWIELNPAAQKKSHKILKTLGIWHVILWNSLNTENYKNLNDDFIHSHGNENLVDSLVYEWIEPFIDNLRILDHLYPDSLDETQFTPNTVIFMVGQSARDTSDIYSNLPVLSFDGDIKKFLKEVDKKIAIAKKSWEDINERELFFPSDIKIAPLCRTQLLERIGEEHIWSMFCEHTLVQNFEYTPTSRWRMNSEPYMRSIRSSY